MRRRREAIGRRKFRHSALAAPEPPAQHFQPIVAEKHFAVANKSRDTENAAGEGGGCLIGQRGAGQSPLPKGKPMPWRICDWKLHQIDDNIRLWSAAA